MSSEVRLQKYIADCGVCSRRSAELLITEGRVSVNGRVIDQLGSKIDPLQDAVKLDGKRLFAVSSTEKVVYALNKPRGCVSTMFDPQGRQTIASFIPRSAPRVYPIGRLDYDSEGLLLLTNDGQLANMIMHPRYQIRKTYLVKVRGSLTAEKLNLIKAGFKLRGKMTSPAKVKEISSFDDKTWYEIAIHEGRNHQLKDTFNDLGAKVLKIKRIRVANIELGDIAKCECRLLSRDVVKDLNQFVEHKTLKVKRR